MADWILENDTIATGGVITRPVGKIGKFCVVTNCTFVTRPNLKCKECGKIQNVHWPA